MRIPGSGVVLALVLMAGAARAEEAPPLTPDQAAAVVVRLWEAKDQAALAVVAAKDDPDPWFVADTLLLLGKREAAAAFAAVAPRKDVEGLPAFVTGWRAGPADVAARKALSDGNVLLQAKKFAEALPLFAGVSADAMPFLKARAEFGEGLALAGQGRGADSAARYAAAAERLENLGWLNRAAMAWLSSARAVDKADLARAIAPLQRLLAVQQRRGNRPGVAGAYDVLGRLRTELKQWNEAAEAHTKALEILTELAEPSFMAMTLNLIGNAVVRAYRAKEAHEAADKALAIAQPGGLNLEVARAHEVHGMAHSLEGHPRQAQASYEAAVAAAVAFGDESLRARMLHASGLAWAEREEHAQALEPLRMSLEIFESLDEGKSPRVTLARVQYALSLATLGKREEAQPLVEAALSEATSASPYTQGISRWAQGRLQRLQGQLSAALISLRVAASRLRDAKETDASFRVVAEIAELLRVEGNLPEARKAADEAVAGAKAIRASLALPHALAVSARLTAAEGRPPEALALAKEARDAYEAREISVGVAAMNVLIAELEAQVPR